MRARHVLFVAAALLCLAGTASPQGRNVDPGAVNRSRAMPHYRNGLDFLRAESWGEAAKAFRDAAGIDPTFEMAFYGIGRASMPQKKYLDAVAAYSKCRDLYLAQAGRQFTNQNEAQRYRQDRILEIDEAIRSYQTGPQTVQTSEALRQLQERKRQVQQNLQRGANLSFDATVPAFVSLSLGSAYFRMEKFPDAEREYKAALAVDPKTGEAHQNLAVVYLETGRFNEAEREVKAAEKVGFRVNPALKEEIAARKKAG